MLLRIAVSRSLRRHDVKPEVKLVHIAQHFIEFSPVTADFHLALIFRLLQGLFFEDDFIQGGAIQRQGGIRRLVNIIERRSRAPGAFGSRSKQVS